MPTIFLTTTPNSSVSRFYAAQQATCLPDTSAQKQSSQKPLLQELHPCQIRILRGSHYSFVYLSFFLYSPLLQNRLRMRSACICCLSNYDTILALLKQTVVGSGRNEIQREIHKRCEASKTKLSIHPSLNILISMNAFKLCNSTSNKCLCRPCQIPHSRNTVPIYHMLVSRNQTTRVSMHIHFLSPWSIHVPTSSRSIVIRGVSPACLMP